VGRLTRDVPHTNPARALRLDTDSMPCMPGCVATRVQRYPWHGTRFVLPRRSRCNSNNRACVEELKAKVKRAWATPPSHHRRSRGEAAVARRARTRDGEGMPEPPLARSSRREHRKPRNREIAIARRDRDHECCVVAFPFLPFARMSWAVSVTLSRASSMRDEISCGGSSAHRRERERDSCADERSERSTPKAPIMR